MKKILIAFDGGAFSSGALDYALNVSAISNALIVGVFIEDLSYLGYATLFGEDYFTFDASLLEKMEKDAMGGIEENMKMFEEKCKSKNVSYKIHLDKGVPAGELIRESRYADMIILTYQTFFSGVAGEGSILKDVLIDAECPVMVVPTAYKEIHQVLLTFDGKSSSVYAIKQFTQLFPSIAQVIPAVLLHVSKSKEEESGSDLMREYLGGHFPNLSYENLSGEAEDALINFAEMQKNPLIVMGAFGRSAFSRFFSKSVTKKLLKEKSLPVFVAHR